MWNNRFLRVLGALLALTMLAAACGSDATNTETADSTLNDAVVDDAMSDDEMSDDEMSDDDEGDHNDDHADAATIDVDLSLPIPEVAMILSETEDPGLFDLKVILANFTVTPDNVNGDPIDNEGHMHLLIDGDKIERFTELERQIMVPEGEHLVEVELNANNHSAYSIHGTPIRTGMTVTGAGEPTKGEGLTAADADVTITATFAAGEVNLSGADRVEVSVDDVVMVMITSDVAEEAHVHGYDIVVDAVPDADAMILFTANTAGRFEIEFEESGTFIAELVVS